MFVTFQKRKYFIRTKSIFSFVRVHITLVIWNIGTLRITGMSHAHVTLRIKLVCRHMPMAYKIFTACYI